MLAYEPLLRHLTLKTYPEVDDNASKTDGQALIAVMYAHQRRPEITAIASHRLMKPGRAFLSNPWAGGYL